MTLVLQIISGNKTEEQISKCVFDESGGVIGRLLENDWVLLGDDYVSREHARIGYEDGHYYVEDLESLDGTFVNDPPPEGQPLSPNEHHALAHGDRLYLGDFEIFVEVEQISSPFLASLDGSSRETSSLSTGRRIPESDGGLKGSPEVFDRGLPPTNFLRDTHFEFPTPDSSHVSPEDIAMNPVSGDGLLLGETNHEKEMPAAPKRGAELPETATSGASLPTAVEGSGTSSLLLEIILRSAGVEPSHLQDYDEQKAARRIGLILRHTVRGLHGLTQTRSKFKYDFLKGKETEVSRWANNSFKQKDGQMSDQQLLCRIFDFDGDRYTLPMDDAVEEVLADVEAHIQATVVGMQAAFDRMCEHLDPVEIKKRAKSDSTPGLLSSRRKPWDLYEERYQNLVGSGFFDAFGKEFREAYRQHEAECKRKRAQLSRER